ncbi:MAG: ABC transporter permease, partial [Phycisphaeraceae bacterium]
KAGVGVFAFIAYGQVVLVCLIAPLFMARAIAAEQSGRTYNILLTTPLSNLQIVLGSLLGRLFLILTLLLSGLPVFSVLLIFGGVAVSSVFLAFAVAGLTALTVGAVAVALSVLRLGGRKAVFSFVIGTMAYLLAAYLVDVAILRQLPGAAGQTTVLTPLHPLLVLESFLNTANYGPPDAAAVAGSAWPVRVYLAQPFEAFALLSGLISVTLLMGSAVWVRRVGQGEGVLSPQGRIGQAVAKRLRLSRAARGVKREARSVWANPIAWREAATRGKATGGILARWSFVVLGFGLGVVLLGLYHFDHLPTLVGQGGGTVADHVLFQRALLALTLLEVAVISLVAIYVSAGAVSREREDGTLDILLTTPITPKDYIWGKLRGLVSFLLLMLAVPVGTLAIASLYGVVGGALGWERATYTLSTFSQSMSSARITREPPLVLPEAPLLLAMMLVPWTAVCVAAGMNWSIKARTVLGAVLPAIGALGALAMVMGFCGGAMVGSVPLLGPLVNAFSPATAASMFIDPWTSVNGFPDRPGMNRVVLFVGSAVAAVGYGLFVYSLILTMTKGFDQTVRRLSGG